MNQAFVLMSKAPRAGDVKTRLCPPLDLVEAASLYRCFFLDTLEKIMRTRTAKPVISYTPASEQAFFESLASGVLLLPQRGADLGARMADCFQNLFAHGYTGVLLTGSDLPTLPQRVFFEAVTRLASAQVDVVLGPSEDGGYYLIGLRTLQRALFEGMTWSTPQVLEETVKRANMLGLRVAYLPTWFDVDTPDDLERLRVIWTREPGMIPAHTREFFAGMTAVPRVDGPSDDNTRV